MISSVKNQETLLYQPFGSIDVVTEITSSMNLILIKYGPTRPRNENIFNFNAHAV